MSTFVLVLFLWIFSVCLHEFAHAAVAYQGGDTTVKDKGYLTLNPSKYLDPMNSLLLPVVFLVMGGIGLPGAAVYINRSLLRSAHWDSAVSLAGPAMNLLLLVLLAGLLGLPAVAASEYAPALAFLALLQASAVVLNLLPLPGFDGYGAIWPYLPAHLRAQFDRYAGYAVLVLFLLLFMVPPFARAFWGLVGLLVDAVGVPLGLARLGYAEFRFWD
ncbi:MAG: site-2 protease family protein [Lysobacterales bacterium]|nr:site-2 protease family protein [Rhodanobacteraceae bacterium]